MNKATIASLAAVVSATAALAIPAAATEERASSDCPAEGEELETAKLYIEHNATDGDTGVHGMLGGEAWSELCVWSAGGELILTVAPSGPLEDLGIADLFFESREPTSDEYPLDELRADFPEGEYLVGGTDSEGTSWVGAATLTHAIPAEPEILSPELADDEDAAADAIVNRRSIVVRWAPVTETVAGDAVNITGYEVIVTKVDHDDPFGLSRPVYDVHLGPEARRLRVPREFVEPGTLYELEVLALEESGNQTIGLGFFTTDAGPRR